MKDYYIAQAMVDVFGPCSVRIERSRYYEYTGSGVVEKNPDQRGTDVYLRLRNWVSPTIRSYSIRIIMYDTPYCRGGNKINTVCCFEGLCSDPWMQQHWEHSDFYATTSKELKKNLLLWKEEIMEY